MERKTKIVTTEWLFIILAWIGIYYLYFIIAFWGTSNFFQEGILKDYLSKWYVHLEMISGSILFGISFCLIDAYTDRTTIRRKSFGKIIIIKSFLYISMTFFAFLLIYGAFYYFEIGPMKNPEVMLEIINTKFIISWILYFIFSIILITFMIQVNKKFGPGNLLKLATGKYHKPRDEHRIFLFLDLMDSTVIAEKLGHHTYSQLLQNCYHDLTDLVIKYKADIYQYVGDEVVLSWNKKDGLNSLNSIKLFFAYQNKLAEQKEFYLKNFKTFPEFKGGMDAGVVTVAEVGDIKREIAYHGDVLNTASRIQAKCKEYKKELLISENLEKSLNQLNGFTKGHVGDVKLRGKEQIVKIYSLTVSE
ncbi:MAG: adenylate/guanylate cyclase domain-containing protein [Ignavibacteriae bacterium]|nr:adenylate/guanylate cyclase domain-containing protein [Ignavibacteriota bacterium]